jgi:hypothetical protein
MLPPCISTICLAMARPSATARKRLAQELGYTGALDGSAEMNIWLHKQVMTKLAESGGKVPDSLKHA